MRSEQGGQVLAFFAVAVPVVLLPIAAYAVDATIVAGREAGLQAAAAQAAETAAQELNVAELRSSGALTIDRAAAVRAATQTLHGEEPGAILDSIMVSGAEVTVFANERVTVPFSVVTQSVTLHASATARLVTGFDAPA